MSDYKEKWIKGLDCVSEYGLYILIFFIPISNAAIEIFFYIIFASFLIKKSLKPDFSFLKSYTHIFLLIFLVFSAASLFNSGVYIEKSIKALIFKWLKNIFIFLLAQDILNNRTRQRNAAVIFLMAAGIVGIDGISQRFLGIEFLRNRPMHEIRTGMVAIYGPMHHYNDFAAYLICVLSLAIGVLFSPKMKKAYRIGLLFIALLLISCLILTFSRGGWLGFVVSIMLMLFLSRKFKLISIVVLILIVLLMSLPVVRSRIFLTFQGGGDSDRFAIWQGTFRMIKENPFLGKGLGTYMSYFAKYIPNLGVMYAHNCYLQIWAEAGIFTLLSFLAFLGILLLKGIRAFRNNKSFILLGLICGILGFAVHSFFDTHFYSLQLSALFWVMAGFSQGLIDKAKQT